MTIDIINKTITIDEAISVGDLIIKLELELKQYRDYTILSNKHGWLNNATYTTTPATFPIATGTTTGISSGTSITAGGLTGSNKASNIKYKL